MQVIPVLDLKQGVVVAARAGMRDDYQPLVSILSAQTEPEAVLDDLLAWHSFRTVYIADLDALMGLGSQAEQVLALACRHPHVEFWFDQGPSGLAFAAARDMRNVVPVLGTESLESGALRCWRKLRGPDFILSLDYIRNRLVGDEFADPSDWPRRVIVMNLDRVGSGYGPGFAQLSEYRSRYPDKEWVAAGGVRDAADLAALRDMGMRAVLVARALHDGSITREELKEWGRGASL